MARIYILTTSAVLVSPSVTTRGGTDETRGRKRSKTASFTRPSADFEQDIRYLSPIIQAIEAENKERADLESMTVKPRN